MTSRGVDVDHLARDVLGALRGRATYADRVEICDRGLDILGRHLDHERGARRPVVGDVDRALVDLSAMPGGQSDDIVDPLADVVDLDAVTDVDRQVLVLRCNLRQVDHWSGRRLPRNALSPKAPRSGRCRHLTGVPVDRRRVGLARFCNVDVGGGRRSLSSLPHAVTPRMTATRAAAIRAPRCAVFTCVMQVRRDH